MKKYNGFTLIELMIVVAIIGVISAISYPSYDALMKKNRRADAKSTLLMIAGRQERFYLRCNTYTTSFGPMLSNCAAGSGINSDQISEKEFYAISISSADSNKFTITATAVTGQPQDRDFTDPAATMLAGDCRVLTLNHRGERLAPSANDPTGTDPEVLDCW